MQAESYGFDNVDKPLEERGHINYTCAREREKNQLRKADWPSAETQAFIICSQGGETQQLTSSEGGVTAVATFWTHHQ